MRSQTATLFTILIGALLCVASNAFSNSAITIHGQVIKAATRWANSKASDAALVNADFSNSRVNVNNGQFTTFITEDGHFSLKNIPPGKYIIEVTSKLFVYEKIVVNFYPRRQDSDSSVSIYSIDPSNFERITDFSNPSRITIKPVNAVPIKYFEEVESFSIMSLLSGQGIMIVVMIFMYICFKNVDMEKLQQQAMEQQADQQAPPVTGGAAGARN